MDKTQGIGLILLFIVFAGYFMLTAPSEAELAQRQIEQDSIANTQILEENKAITKPVAKPIIAATDTAAIKKLQTSYGAFGNAMVGAEQEGVLENDKLKITFSSKGGKIKKALVKGFYKITEDAEFNQNKGELYLLEDEKNKFEYLIPTQGGSINTSELNFIPQVQGNTITMTASLGNGGELVQKYTLKDGDYLVDHAFQMNGVNQLLDPSNNKMRFRWHNYLDRLELNTNFEKYYSTIYFKESGETSDYCNCRSDDKEELEASAKIDWVSNVNQFFNTSIIAKNKKFENGTFETVSLDAEGADMKLLKSDFDIPLDLVANESIENTLYIGPNEFERLDAMDNGLEEIIPFGRSIFGSINRWVIRPAFNWLSSFIGTKGIVIIVLIFILKMLLYPLMYKMLHSQAKMGILKPEIAELKSKFPDDHQKVQMETMKLYKEYGVSPLGGCFPMLLQMPIWYALFRFFPASITFRQEPFLWATDLSSYDVFMRLPFDIPAFGAHISMFTILWAVTTIIYSYYNMRHMDMSANPAMKYVQYFMPITFLFFFNSYASGLTVYMFFSNLFNIAQTVITKKFVFKDEKLRAELEVNKSKPKKTGGFQSRLEEAMKQQQELAKKKSNQTPKKKKR